MVLWPGSGGVLRVVDVFLAAIVAYPGFDFLIITQWAIFATTLMLCTSYIFCSLTSTQRKSKTMPMGAVCPKAGFVNHPGYTEGVVDKNNKRINCVLDPNTGRYSCGMFHAHHKYGRVWKRQPGGTRLKPLWVQRVNRFLARFRMPDFCPFSLIEATHYLWFDCM